MGRREGWVLLQRSTLIGHGHSGFREKELGTYPKPAPDAPENIYFLRNIYREIEKDLYTSEVIYPYQILIKF
ncbi:MAG: hypothetical protein ACOC32_01845 [Nanoarchaeota archaeon]